MKVYRTGRNQKCGITWSWWKRKDKSCRGDALRIRCNESYGKDFRMQYGERF